MARVGISGLAGAVLTRLSVSPRALHKPFASGALTTLKSSAKTMKPFRCLGRLWAASLQSWLACSSECQLPYEPPLWLNIATRVLSIEPPS